MLTRVRIVNFRSFDDFQVELGSFNVFIGANAAGKSNFVEAFRFLRESLAEGITVAVARRQGWPGVRCRKRYSNEIHLGISGMLDIPPIQPPDGERRLSSEGEFSYKVTLEHRQEEDDIVVQSEIGQISEFGKELISGFERDQEKWRVKGSLERLAREEHEDNIGLGNRTRLFLAGSRFMTLASVLIGEEMTNWRVYNLDPKEARTPRLAQDVDCLSETADNLALVLHQMRPGQGNGTRGTEEEPRTKIMDIMTALVPGFEKWTTESLADGRISFKVKEKSLKGYLPPILLSDGTIRLLSILAALLYGQQQRPSTIFMEEPERNLHPNVMQQVVELMREVSEDAQIIVTTHSPDFVRHCHTSEVYLMDKVDGLTQVVRPIDTEQIDDFLKNFTLDQLWLMGYLERGVP